MSDQSYLTDETLNELADDGEMWGLLLFLRPAQHRRFSSARVTLISVLCGGFYGALSNLPLALLSHMTRHATPPLYLMPLILAVLCYAGLQVTVAAAWNRRAHQMARQADWKAQKTAARVTRGPEADNT